VSALLDWRYTLRASWVAVASTFLVGVVDLFFAPAMGLITLVLALAGMLLTIAATSGRVRPGTVADRGTGESRR
jgi:hypothetical protein